MQSEFSVWITFVVSVMMASSVPGSLAKKWRSIVLNRVSSTFLGSTSTNLTSAGCFLYRMDARIAFSPTDLPCPVAPAIKRCGIFARSTTNTSFEIVLPSANGRSMSDFWNFSDASTERILTI